MQDSFAATPPVDDLTQARRGFERWRRTRPRGERIPSLLWSKATSLARDLGVSKVSQALGLDYYALQRRAGQKPERTHTQEGRTKHFGMTRSAAQMVDAPALSCSKSARVHYESVCLAFRARALMERLGRFLDGFAGCFVRRAHSGRALQYVQGLLSDAKAKNMEGMLSRLPEPCDYQSMQHFMTHSTWDAQKVWPKLRSAIPERRGMFLIDDTGVPKQGSHSVGVTAQYCGAVGKIANSQNIVTSVLYSGRQTWPIAMQLYMPEKWCSDAKRRAAARVPESLAHKTKLVIALEQLDLAIAAKFEIECVLADAGYGESTEFREEIASRGLYYSVGVGMNVKVFTSPPTFEETTTPSRPQLAPGSSTPKTVEEVVDEASPREWKRIAWREGVKGKLQAEFLIKRVAPSHRWDRGRKNEEVWLICERTLGANSVRKYFLSNLPSATDRKELVRITYERWAIEMHYRDLKQELGLDHFEGRSYPGLARHLVLTALAYVFLQIERGRKRSSKLPSLNSIRRSVTEILTAMLFTMGERFASLVAELARDPPRTR